MYIINTCPLTNTKPIPYEALIRASYFSNHVEPIQIYSETQITLTVYCFGFPENAVAIYGVSYFNVTFHLSVACNNYLLSQIRHI